MAKNILYGLTALALLTTACQEQDEGQKSDWQPSKPKLPKPIPLAEKGKSMFRSIEANMLASPQISIADVAEAKAQGVTLIINNRPDGEEPTAPQSADIEAAAKAAGIDYISIPVTHAGFSRPQIDSMTAALEKARGGAGKVLAYCRSGTRSTLLWALSQASKGESPRVIAAKAADAGYDVAPIAMMLDTLAGAAKAQ